MPVSTNTKYIVDNIDDISSVFIDMIFSHSILFYSIASYYKNTDDVHAYLRNVLASLYDDEVAQETRIQYGGSVTPDSVDELMAQPEIDGCLVGGASLVADKFGRIINFVHS